MSDDTAPPRRPSANRKPTLTVQVPTELHDQLVRLADRYTYSVPRITELVLTKALTAFTLEPVDPAPVSDDPEVQRWAEVLRDADYRREMAEQVQAGSGEPWWVQQARVVVAELNYCTFYRSPHPDDTPDERRAMTELAERAGYPTEDPR